MNCISCNTTTTLKIVQGAYKKKYGEGKNKSGILTKKVFNRGD
ncbi:hypothetical protein HMPREF0765_2205 [Sphingobacterium spiritivorum ATCC 33300]|uniref:Uncharacterized protein n=1 Tax=Sphingobacterium spiritivorum ATCC 33300 TaxID=525372 RepID=C2FXZ9_SPHSI|nr:hypothetical protein HMPREF0765_2205 [Sphingobacterium spiritivorum ATCC 33300]